MSVSSELYKVNVVGDGSTPSIAFNRKVFNSTDIKGFKYNTTTNVETALVNGTDFTVAGAGDTSSGVTITPSAIIPTGTNWVIYSDAGNAQNTTLTTAGEFPAKSLEYAFDKLSIGTQEADGKADRALKLPVSDTASADLPNKTDRASKYLGFDSNGDPTALAGGTATDSGDISYLAADAGATSRTVESRLRDVISVKDYGAVGDGSTDDRAAIQAAIDAVSAAGGGQVFLAAGTYIVGGSGSTNSSREYGLNLKDGVTLAGDGRFTTTIKVADSADIDLIISPTATSNTGLGIKNMTLDGNESNQGATPSNGFNVWFYDVTGVDIENVKSLNPASWGIRIENSSQIQMNQIRCDHSAETNSDGIHLLDCSDVYGSDFHVVTAGDDAFIIEANYSDISNYVLSNLYVKAANALDPVLPARGLLLNTEESVVTATRTMSNMQITNVVAEDCSGHGIILTGCFFENIKIDGVVNGGGSVSGLYLAPGTSAVPGTTGIVKNCEFNVSVTGVTGRSISTVDTYGDFTHNKINAIVTESSDSTTAVDLYGTYWSGDISVYNVTAEPSYSIVLYEGYNNLNITAIGGDRNLYLQGGSDYNSIRIGVLKDGVANDLETVGGSQYNTFTGGYVGGTVVNGSSLNKFENVIGCSSYGEVSLNMATEGDGTVVFAHGLGATPRVVDVQICSSGGVAIPAVIKANLGSTNVDLEIRDDAGALITTGTLTAYFKASV